MKKIIVLGCGRVGACIAADLAADEHLQVTVVDQRQENLEGLGDLPGLCRRQLDLHPGAVGELVAGFDAVVGALPSVLGFEVLRGVIEAGKPYCDISFMPVDFLSLDELARQRGVPAVVDCGVAPGLANLLIGYAQAHFDAIESAFYYVGGLPRERDWPYEYKAPFAPSDVLEEYTRPVHQRIDGKPVTKAALSEAEPFELEGVGTLEAFNTDGLRSLLKTIKAPTLWEKTLRYPVHAELMRVFAHTGLLDTEAVEVNGQWVRPRDLTAKLLFPLWQSVPGEREFTVLKVQVDGQKEGRPMSLHGDLFDEGDPAGGESSMARTTGFPCAIVTRLLLGDERPDPGVIPPERLGERPGLMDKMVNELKARGVDLRVRVEEGKADGHAK